MTDRAPDPLPWRTRHVVVDRPPVTPGPAQVRSHRRAGRPAGSAA